jgi:iron complex outermembrane receptor protein
VRLSISGLTLAGLCLSNVVFAADPVISEPITVTATRFSSGLSAAPVNVSIIDEREIAQSGAATLGDLLKLQTGVQVLDYIGGGSGQTRIDMGGFGQTGNQNTLVLLNGRRLNDVDLEGANLASIPLESIARVEILHGTAAVAYGDNAVGGVINIITKSGYEGPTANAEASGGSYRSGSVSATVNATGAAGAAFLTARGYHTDGYRDNSELDNNNVAAEVSRNAGDTRYGLRAGAYHEAQHLPGALYEPDYLADPRMTTRPNDKAYEDLQSVEGFVSGGRFAAELGLRRKSQNAYLFGTTEADLDTVSFTPRYTWSLPKQTLVTGLDAYRSTLATDAVFGGPFPASNSSDTRRDSLAAYISDAIDLADSVALNLGFRRQGVYLDMSNIDLLASAESGAKRDDWLNAWDATLAWHRGGTRVYARTAESFRFPVLDEMWSYYSGTITPLLPQRSRHLEIGTALTRGAFTLEANAFHILVKDEIGFNSATYSNENLDPTRHDGMDLGAGVAFGDHASARLGWTYRDARFRSGPFDGNAIPEIPRNTLTLATLLRVAEGQRIGLDGVYTGERYFGNDFANVGKTMPTYVLLNVHYTYVRSGWKLRVRVDNLTDKQAADIGFYNSFAPNPYAYYPLPGRTTTFSVAKDF